MLAADQSAARSILVFKTDEDKMVPLDDTKLVAMAGAPGDRSQLGDYLARNIKLTKLKTGYTESCYATANFVRRQVNSSYKPI